MKLLLVCLAYPPMVNSAARLFADLAEGLAARGHDVRVLTGMPDRYLAEGQTYRRRLYYLETINGVRVHHVAGVPFPRHIPFLRGLEQFSLASLFLITGLFLGRQKAIIVYSPPLPLGMTGYLLARVWHGRLIVNVQDLYPQTAIDLGLLRSRALISFSRWMERFLYQRADAITVHSDGNRQYIIEHGATPERVHTIFNWVDLAELAPGERNNSFRRRHSLDADAFVVSYAGVMGFAQGLEEVVEAAGILRDRPEILFLLVGDGVMRPWLEARVRELGLTNVRFIGTQPPEVYPCLLAASAVGLVTLRKELTTPVVPGKLQSIMAAGRGVVCSMNLCSDAVQMVKNAGCGVWVEAGRPADLAEAISSLAQDPERTQALGEKGREYASRYFDRTQGLNRYEALLESFHYDSTERGC